MRIIQMLILARKGIYRGSINLVSQQLFIFVSMGIIFLVLIEIIRA